MRLTRINRLMRLACYTNHNGKTMKVEIEKKDKSVYFVTGSLNFSRFPVKHSKVCKYRHVFSCVKGNLSRLRTSHNKKKSLSYVNSFTKQHQVYYPSTSIVIG